MANVQLRALQPFPYDKRRLAVGEMFEATEKLGALFVKQGRAEPAEALTPVDLPAEVMSRAFKHEPITETEEVKAKPVAPLSYKTRHMEAEKPKAVEKPTVKPMAAKVEAPAPKKRGRPFGSGNRSR